MRALGNYLLRTRIHSILTISVLTVLSLFVSPLSYFISGAPMGLVALRKGPVAGLQVALGSLLLLALLAMALKTQPLIPGALMFFVWLPVITCALVLRATQSQGLSVLCAGIAGIVFAVYINLTIEQFQEWWRAWFDYWKEYAAPNFTLQQLERIYEAVNPLISAFLVSGFVLSLITTTLLARWWQSTLFNPGGFRSEFYSLRLPRSLVFPTLLGLFAFLFMANDMPLALRDVLIVVLILYLYQGLSIIHGFIHGGGLSIGWLIAMYALFFLLPLVVVLLVVGAGIVNACLVKTAGIKDEST